MLNISFCSDSLSLRTASLISPLPLQPELCPQGVREASLLLPPPIWCSPPPRSEPKPINVASAGPGKGSILKKKPLGYLET